MRVAERSRYAFMASLALLAAVLGAPLAHAAPYAAIVMDMRDGRVMHSRSADRRQHPASLTKMMTLYLTFEALEQGRVGLDQRVRVSAHAARQPASKLYLKRGQRVTIRHLIRATAIKSANDAAMVLAEAIGGSQAGFAKMMTTKARQLGMTKTTFRNPHGLTSSGHLSTARDMAVLARRLYFDFPQYYNVFGRKTAAAAGKTVRTTNRLLHSYRGAEGMKTGYTRAAGYNLVAIAKRGPKRVIAIVMGGRSGRTRNRRVAELLDMGFQRAHTHVAEIRPRDAITLVAAIEHTPLPRARPGTNAVGLAAVAQALAARPAVASAVAASAYAPLYSMRPPGRPGRRATRLAAAPAGPAAKPGWAVQLGIFDDRAQAVESVASVTLSDVTTLAAAESEIKEVKGAGGRMIYEVRFTGLAARDASRACNALISRGRDCIALAPH